MAKIIGDYEITEVLGSGSFSIVKKGIHKKTKDEVAIKILKKDKIIKEDLYEHLRKEIQVLKVLKHPNIIQLIEVLDSSSFIYLILQLVKGVNLFDMIVQKGKIQEQEAKKYFRQLMSAITYCGENHIVHRDLKPENIIIDQTGNVKISDFGLAGIFKVEEDKLMETTCGTMSYIAPEILSTKAYDGHIADI